MKITHRLLLLTLLCLALAALSVPAQEPAPVSGEEPFVLGVTRTIRSDELGETRKLNIYLPPGHGADPEQRFPVIYLLDGSADEDFIHVAGLVQYANFPWVKMLPPTILVGIANVDRRRDFTYPTRVEKDKKEFPTAGGSARFIAFIEKELQPFIEKEYRAGPRRTLIGQSLGGLLATEILLKKPSLFDRYVIVSPSLWWDRGSLLKDRKKTDFERPTGVYVAVGREGEVMERDARRLAARLRVNPSVNLTTHFGYFADEDHATIFHPAVYDAFRKLGPEK